MFVTYLDERSVGRNIVMSPQEGHVERSAKLVQLFPQNIAYAITRRRCKETPPPVHICETNLGNHTCTPWSTSTQYRYFQEFSHSNAAA